MVRHLPEFIQELAVINGDVNFVTELVERRFGRIEDFRSGQAEQGWLVGGREEFKIARHRSLQFQAGN